MDLVILSGPRIGHSLAIVALAGCAGGGRGEPPERPAIAAEAALLAPDHPDVLRYRARHAEIQPTEALQWLVEGNQRYTARRQPATEAGGAWSRRMGVSAVGQRPIAAVLSCIDSRTAPEWVFDTAPGDLLTVRVGANVVNNDVLGSLEVAAESGVRVIVVLGHSDCGGVKLACAGTKLGHFTELLSKVTPAIEEVNARLDGQPGLAAQVGPREPSNRTYVRHIGRVNAEHSAARVLAESDILRKKVAAGTLILVPALFHVETGRVDFGRAMTADDEAR